MCESTKIPCVICDGQGSIEYFDDDYFDPIYCVDVFGSLEYKQYTCDACNGTGSFLEALKKSNARQHQESALATKLRTALSI